MITGHLLLGELYLEGGTGVAKDAKKTIVYWTQALERLPDAYWHTQLAKLHLHGTDGVAENTTQALAHINKALELDPASDEAKRLQLLCSEKEAQKKASRGYLYTLTKPVRWFAKKVY